MGDTLNFVSVGVILWCVVAARLVISTPLFQEEFVIPEDEDDEEDELAPNSAEWRYIQNRLAFRKLIKERFGLANFSRVAFAEKASDTVINYVTGKVNEADEKKEDLLKSDTPNSELPAPPPQKAVSATSNKAIPVRGPSSPDGSFEITIPAGLNSSEALIQLGFHPSMVEVLQNMSSSMGNPPEEEGISNIESAILEALLQAQVMTTSRPIPTPAAPTPTKTKKPTRTKVKATTEKPSGPLGWFSRFVPRNPISWAWDNLVWLANTDQAQYAYEVAECHALYNCNNNQEKVRYPNEKKKCCSLRRFKPKIVVFKKPANVSSS